ncbi:MAG: diguanylate cyclase [Lachnospiraceae bacterium]|jgi:diguanylate cyclase (GGDEF)-like protein|nr:diguanylate cyclase [Lachnospiraceae bacterium]
MIQDIYIVDEEKNFTKKVQEVFINEHDYKFIHVIPKDLDIALKNIPALLIVNEDSVSMETIDVCKKIRQNEDNSITPIIVISSNTNKKHRVEILSNSVEYYIINPIDNDYLYYTIKNIIRLMDTNRRVSPLTGLPGNVQIQAEMKKKLLNHEKFSVMYLDLDNFKAYNDIYGFLQGDEIIKLTARIIQQNINLNSFENCFVGHIGGDDFLALLSETEETEKTCQNIIGQFDNEILEFYNDLDRQRGYIEVANRRGIMEQFALTSISIGVVIADEKRFHNTLEIAEVGAQVKHTAKTIMGSSYVIDKRMYRTIVEKSM